MTGAVSFRNASTADAYDLAYLHALASGGMVEFFYQDIVPGAGPVDLFAETMASDGEPYTWRNCVAADKGGEVIGMLHCYPADDEAKFEDDPRIPADRYEVLVPLDRLMVPGTWYICAVAVRPGNRRQGTGSRFMQLANDQARERSFTELTLHVFEDNQGAIELYETLGFQITDRAALDHAAFTRHEGDLLLMRRAVL